MEKTFVNGFYSWRDTHHEVVSGISSQLIKDVPDSVVISELYSLHGTTGMYDFAEQLTDEFEKLHEGRQWDGEYFDVVEAFIKEKLFPKE